MNDSIIATSASLVLANPRGFCAGVDRAIDIVNRALEVFGAPIYVRHEVVHNKFVVEDLRERGAIFVDELSEVPDDVIVILVRMVFHKLCVKKPSNAV